MELAPRHKAAILLSSLPAEVTDQLKDALEPEMIEVIRKELASLPPVSREERARILEAAGLDPGAPSTPW